MCLCTKVDMLAAKLSANVHHGHHGHAGLTDAFKPIRAASTTHGSRKEIVTAGWVRVNTPLCCLSHKHRTPNVCCVIFAVQLWQESGRAESDTGNSDSRAVIQSPNRIDRYSNLYATLHFWDCKFLMTWQDSHRTSRHNMCCSTVVE